MSDNPWGDTEVSVTLKQHAKYDAPWIVIRGKDTETVKRELEKVAGLSGEGISLASLVYNSAEHFKKVGEVGTVLGGTVISADAPDPKPQAAAQQPVAEPAAPAPTLKDLVAQAATGPALSDLFLKHKAAFMADPALMAALEARSKQV